MDFMVFIFTLRACRDAQFGRLYTQKFGRLYPTIWAFPNYIFVLPLITEIFFPKTFPFCML